LSVVAFKYVKKDLPKAPNGEAISIQERALLWYLADGHNEENGGVAWPKVSTLAEYHNVSDRQIRRILSEMERKQIIERIPKKRANGSYTESDYIFLELGYDKANLALSKSGGKQVEKPRKPVQKPVKSAPPTLTPMSVPPDAGDRRGTDTSVSRVLTPVSPLELVLEPALESLPEPAVSPLPPKGGETATAERASDEPSDTDQAHDGIMLHHDTLVDVPAAEEDADEAALHELAAELDARHDKWSTFKTTLLGRLERLPVKLRANALDWYRQGVENTFWIDEEMDDNEEMVWTIGSPDPVVTGKVLQKLLERDVKAALWSTAKCTVQVRVFVNARSAA